jgi:hypothetical protein
MFRSGLSIAGLAVAISSAAHAADFFVVTASLESQTKAQVVAAETGGWVLDTDAYAGFAPNLFAIVRGPFRSKADAAAELDFLASGGQYPGAYVKEGGASRLPQGLVDRLSPATVAALLGEILLDVESHPGGADPCEPQEPYEELRLSYVTVNRSYDDATGKVSEVSERVEIPIGSFRIVKRTGELSHMRLCVE